MAKNTTPLVIGISGGTGSGKTTVANVILERVGIGNISSSDAYEYYYVDSLKVINSEQSDVRLSFISDDQIKTKEGVKKGIGL